MKFEVVVGRILQLAGKLFQLWGELTGNELQRLKGYQLVALGQIRVLGVQAAELLRYCSPRQALTLQAGAASPGPAFQDRRAPNPSLFTDRPPGVS